MNLLSTVLTMLIATTAAQGAELKVLSGNGAKAAVRELCSQFEKSTGNKISLRFEVNADLKKKIEAGETLDVAVLNPRRYATRQGRRSGELMRPMPVSRA